MAKALYLLRLWHFSPRSQVYLFSWQVRAAGWADTVGEGLTLSPGGSVSDCQETHLSILPTIHTSCHSLTGVLPMPWPQAPPWFYCGTHSTILGVGNWSRAADFSTRKPWLIFLCQGIVSWGGERGEQPPLSLDNRKLGKFIPLEPWSHSETGKERGSQGHMWEQSLRKPKSAHLRAKTPPLSLRGARGPFFSYRGNCR